MPHSAEEQQTGGRFVFPIERGQVRDFAHAAHSSNPAYDGPDALIPPTFLSVGARKWANAKELLGSAIDFEPRRILHGEEEYLFHGPPPRVGSTLTATTRVADRYEKEGKRGGAMRFAVISTEFRDGDGRLVAEQRTTLVETADRSAPR